MDPQRDGQGSHAQVEANNAIVSQLARQDKIPWYNKPNLRLLYLLMVPACLGVEMTSGFDASMMNSLQAVPSWLEYYNHPRSAALGLMVSMDSLGSLSAVPFAASLVNETGRRYPIFLGGMISIVGSILQASALNFVMFVAARFMLGFASVFCIVAASSLIGELSHPKERAIMSSLFKTFYFPGAVAAAVVTFWTFSMTSNWGWRIPSLLQVVPSLLQVCFILLLPESPRWLISRGRIDEAYAILVKYHAEGDQDSEFVNAEYTQIKDTLEAELRIARMNEKGTFSTPGMRKRLIIASFLGLFTQWSGSGLVAHYLSPILDSIGIHDNRTKHIINIAKFSWSLVNATFIAFTAPRYPRRWAFLACTISLLVVFTAWTIASAEYTFTHSQVSAQVVLVLIFLYSPAYNIAFAPLPYTYLVELFPFHARAGGISLYQWCCRGAALFDRFANPIGMDLAGWRWYIFYCVWIAFEVGFIYFMFPETSGRTLEELTFLYEDDDREATRDPERHALLEYEERVTGDDREDG